MRVITAVLLAGISVSGLAYSKGSMDQVALDRECEQARRDAMIPMREEAIAQCIQQGKKSESECREYFKAYEGPPNRPALFYDLPECKKAYEARKAAER